MVSDEYGQKMAPMLQTVQEQFDVLQHMGQSSSRHFYLSKNDFESFCGHVLRNVSSFVRLQESMLDLEEYMPPECVIKIYLDQNIEREIVCTIDATYGSHVYRVSDWTMQNQGGYRDVSAEKFALDIAKRYLPHETRVEGQHYLVANKENEIYDLVSDGIHQLGSCGQVYVSEDIRNIRVKRSPSIVAGVKVKGDLLAVNIEMPELSAQQTQEILEAYRSEERRVGKEC